VTVIVDDICVLPVFVAINEGTLPDPLEASPIAVFELLQVKFPPAGILVKFVAVTVALLQTDIFVGTFTVEIG